MTAAWQGDLESTYDGTEKSVTATLSDVLETDQANVTLAYTNNTTYKNEATNAGSYVASASLSGSASENYALKGADKDGYIYTTWEITQADISNDVTLDASGMDKDYDGKVADESAAELFGYPEIDTNETVEYYTEDGQTKLENAPIDAGTYTIKVTLTDLDGNYKPVEKTDTYTIAKKKVTANVTAQDKVYDGNKGAKVSATVETGIDGEALAITGLTGTFDDANAGTDKTVTIDSSKAVVTAAEGNDKTNAANYEVSYPATATADITEADMDDDVKVDIDALNKTYDGKAVKNPSVERPSGSSMEVEYYKIINFEAGEVEKLESAPVDAGDYIVVVTVSKANYYDVYDGGKFTIAKSSEVKSPDTDTVKAVAETIKGKKDGQITGLDDTMEYSTDGGKTYNVIPEGITELTNLPAGTYLVRYKATDNYNASEAIELTIADGKQLDVTLPETSNGEYTITAEPSKVDYDGSTTVTVTITDGCEVTNDFKLVAAYKDEEGQTQKVTYKGVQDPDDASKYTFTIDNVETDLALSIPTDGVQDVQAPTATVTVDNIAWKEFLNNATFGRFFKESKTVKVEATDNCGADNVKVEYYLSDEALTED